MQYIVLIFCLSQLIFSQVFNTSKILSEGSISVAGNLTSYSSPTDYQLNLMGGYGLASNFDFSARLGLFSNDMYFGADIEYEAASFKGGTTSFSSGFHMWNDTFGLDGTAIYSRPLTDKVNIYGALDMDLDFSGFMTIYSWAAIGVDIPVSNNMKFLLEGDIGLNSRTSNKFTIGMYMFL